MISCASKEAPFVIFKCQLPVVYRCVCVLNGFLRFWPPDINYWKGEEKGTEGSGFLSFPFSLVALNMRYPSSARKCWKAWRPWQKVKGKWRIEDRPFLLSFLYLVTGVIMWNTQQNSTEVFAREPCCFASCVVLGPHSASRRNETFLSLLVIYKDYVRCM